MENENLESYSLENFIENESFINYCLRKNRHDFDFWQNWIINHPEKEKQVEKAAYYVLHFLADATEYEYQKELDKAETRDGTDVNSSGYHSELDFLYRNNYPKQKNGKSRTNLLWGLSTLAFLLFTGVILTVRSCR